MYTDLRCRNLLSRTIVTASSSDVAVNAARRAASPQSPQYISDASLRSTCLGYTLELTVKTRRRAVLSWSYSEKRVQTQVLQKFDVAQLKISPDEKKEIEMDAGLRSFSYLDKSFSIKSFGQSRGYIILREVSEIGRTRSEN
ncbi:hypothetical protein MPTK1_6g20560 [Marchantia polymorpha subsp. ruderalis]|uniref:Uncharacterized protein n=2 Tax=Marchantia polymorpha TaxID=3197 RepID=A0AAF6BU80_MARPO|nr:hypothetical protein MARPO_0045s0008 [Marchantia polymorpha]BBN15564.1 hypothetical protein Mp_6g20560 [Marchantia polymorpha subsp. ruderalis]|eukprot:PTQ39325.1 hypothetical protein MARPO_0045s0008 [Marchantia polymorpha]